MRETQDRPQNGYDARPRRDTDSPDKPRQMIVVRANATATPTRGQPRVLLVLVAM